MLRDKGLVNAETPPEESAASSDLLEGARQGDRSALDALFARLFPWLRRRARGRLPRWARGALDTSDVVQEVLLHTIRRISGFESSSSVAFRVYLLRAVDHRIRDEMRRAGRRDTQGDLEERELPAEGPSPLQQLVDNEDWERYLRALKRLTAARAPADRRPRRARVFLQAARAHRRPGQRRGGAQGVASRAGAPLEGNGCLTGRQRLRAVIWKQWKRPRRTHQVQAAGSLEEHSAAGSSTYAFRLGRRTRAISKVLTRSLVIRAAAHRPLHPEVQAAVSKASRATASRSPP